MSELTQEQISEALTERPPEQQAVPAKPAPTKPTAPMSEAQAKPQTFEQKFEYIAGTSLGCMVRGLLTSVLGAPVDWMLITICLAAGRVVGSFSCQGDFATLLRLRADCKDAFKNGVDSVKIIQPPATKADGEDLYRSA